jgi:hypothetical protein
MCAGAVGSPGKVTQEEDKADGRGRGRDKGTGHGGRRDQAVVVVGSQPVETQTEPSHQVFLCGLGCDCGM